MLEKYLLVFILGMLPISEVRGAIIYGVGNGLHISSVFFLGALGNVLIVPAIFWVLNKWKFLKIAKKFFGKRAYGKIDKNRELINKWGVLSLLVFVAIPLPITGAWMGSLVAVLLKMDKKRAFITISAGVLVAGLIVLSSVLGLINALKIF